MVTNTEPRLTPAQRRKSVFMGAVEQIDLAVWLICGALAYVSYRWFGLGGGLVSCAPLFLAVLVLSVAPLGFLRERRRVLRDADAALRDYGAAVSARQPLQLSSVGRQAALARAERAAERVLVNAVDLEDRAMDYYLWETKAAVAELCAATAELRSTGTAGG